MSTSCKRNAKASRSTTSPVTPSIVTQSPTLKGWLVARIMAPVRHRIISFVATTSATAKAAIEMANVALRRPDQNKPEEGNDRRGVLDTDDPPSLVFRQNFGILRTRRIRNPRVTTTVIIRRTEVKIEPKDKAPHSIAVKSIGIFAKLFIIFNP